MQNLNALLALFTGYEQGRGRAEAAQQSADRQQAQEDYQSAMAQAARGRVQNGADSNALRKQMGLGYVDPVDGTFHPGTVQIKGQQAQTQAQGVADRGAHMSAQDRLAIDRQVGNGTLPDGEGALLMGQLPTPRATGLTFGPNAVPGAVPAPQTTPTPGTVSSDPTTPPPMLSSPANLPAVPAGGASPNAAGPILPKAAAPGAVNTGPGAVVNTGTTRIYGTHGVGPLARQRMLKMNADQKRVEAETALTADKDTGQGYINSSLYQKSLDQKGLDAATISQKLASGQLDRATAAKIATMTPVEAQHLLNTDALTARRLQIEAQRAAQQGAYQQGMLGVAGRNADTNAGRLGVDRWKAHNPTGRASGKPFDETSPQYNSMAKEATGLQARVGEIQTALAGQAKDANGATITLSPAQRQQFQAELGQKQQRISQINRILSGGAVAPRSAPAGDTIPLVVGGKTLHISRAAAQAELARRQGHR